MSVACAFAAVWSLLNGVCECRPVECKEPGAPFAMVSKAAHVKVDGITFNTCGWRAICADAVVATWASVS